MPSGPSFDPSRQWLGIDAVDLADPRRVLGLPADAVDREVISRAADDRLAKLRGVDPGPFTIAHAALIRRVEQSRDELLISVPVRSASGFASPPPPSRPGGPVPPARPRPPAGPRPPAPEPQRRPADRLAVPPPPVPAASTNAPDGPIVLQSAQRRHRSLRRPLLLIAVAVAGLIAFRDRLEPVRDWLMPYRDRAIALAQDASEEFSEYVSSSVAPPPAARTAPAEPTDSPGTSVSQPVEPIQPADPQPGSRGPAQSPTERADPAAARPLMTELTPAEAAGVGPTGTAPTAPGIEPPTMPRPAAEPTPALRGGRDRGPGDVRPERRVPPPTERDAGIDDLLIAARAALAANAFDQADDLLVRARDAAGEGPAADRVAGWEQLAAHARRFAVEREKALKAGMGRDFDVGKDRISVVEVNDRLFIFRHAGRNLRVPLDKVPEAIAMTLTKKWFAGGGHAANYLFIGARYLTRPDPDPAAARTAWLAAQQGGADVSALLPLLDDPAVRGPLKPRR